jgi:hypothetical protein
VVVVLDDQVLLLSLAEVDDELSFSVAVVSVWVDADVELPGSSGIDDSTSSSRSGLNTSVAIEVLLSSKSGL